MPDLPPLSDPAGLAGRVDRVFDATDGGLAVSLSGFEPRAGQRRLARAVAEIFEQGGTLVAEAGTGTGKTLAYLVPAVLAGRRVLVSTGTRNLQDQVYYKDVPALARALGRDVRAAYMKGRTNYACRHRFGRLEEAEAGLPPGDRARLAAIREWLAHTETGDRAELDELPDDAAIWADVTATREQCLGRECPDYQHCFVTRMRDRAAEADLVIVNHHLLCADASVREDHFGAVVPDCDLLVVDEAHQLEDVATQYFGIALGAHRLDELVRDAARCLAERSARPGPSDRAMPALADVQQTGRQLFEAVRLDARGQPGGGDRVRLTPEMAGRLAPAREAFARALDVLQRAVDRPTGSPDGSRDDLDPIATRVRTMRQDLKALLDAADPSYVHFVELRGRGVLLRAAPIDASTIIRETILGARHGCVLTSATLAVGGDFTYALSRLGVPEATTLQLSSEFDFPRQALLYLPASMPDPRTPAFNAAAADTIEELLACTAGRAFVLFTSYAAMRDVHARLVGRLAWPLLVQGSAPRSTLLRDFRATPHAVLLATASFWQGVDVAGDALSCVIVDRLPFASPGDPLVAARMAALEARGGLPFQEYQIPQATITLLQGLGRLIRTRADRGVMAVLDPRLTRMAYGRHFLASLPPAALTRRLEDVRAFFGAS